MRGRRTAPQARRRVQVHRKFGRDDEHHGIKRQRDAECQRERDRGRLTDDREPRSHISRRRLEISAGGSAATASVAAGAALACVVADARREGASMRVSVIGMSRATERRALILARRGPLLR